MITSCKTNQESQNLAVFRWAWAALFILQVCFDSAVPALAQRRRSEPEADPQFQQDVQEQSSGGGGPVEAESGTQPAARIEDADIGRESAPSPTRAIQGVQIGSAPMAPAVPPSQGNPMETRVTVRMKEAPLAVFLDSISAQSNVNFIISEGLEQKRLTVFLQNVTVREALQILLEIKGLTYQGIGRSNTYIVSRRSQGAPIRITRIYTLSYITLIPIAGVARGDKSGAISGGRNLGGSQRDSASGTGGGGDGGTPGGVKGDSQIDDGSRGILGILASVLSKNGRVSVDPRTNSIIVTDVPEVFPQIEQIIQELDKKAPQVMIEAQIVEINSDRAQQLGLEWGGTSGELARFTGGARDTTFPFNLPSNLSHAHIFNPITSVTSGLGSGGGGTSGTSGSGSTTSGASNLVIGSLLKTGVVDLGQLSVILRALVTRSEARFLGKPKILTLNNKQARIEISQKQAIASQSTTVSLGSGNSGTQSSTGVEREQTGLQLNVTPQVNKEGYITLLVEPSFTDIVASSVANSFDPVSRSAMTLVRVKSGQTLVLGGLLSSRENKVVRKVPFLGYIPLLGWLFTSVSTQRHNTDLVIFLTPTIIND